MTRVSTLLVAIAVGLTAVLSAAERAERKAAAGPHIGHMVYFKLKDASAANKQKLVEACDKYLSNHEGTVFYAAGVRAEDIKEPVSDRDWDVALQLVFDSKAAYTKYAKHPEHLKFIDENKALWAGVRVFDSEFTPTKK